MTVHLLTEQKPAYFLKKPRFLSSNPLPSFKGELFSTSRGDFVRKGGLVLRDVGTGARQQVDPRNPLQYRRAPDVQPETLSKHTFGRLLTQPTVFPKQARLTAEVAPAGGEVYRGG